MSKPEYTYQKFTNVNGGNDILSKLYTFAVAQGWTATYYETGKAWREDSGDPGTYIFSATEGGTLEDHLQLVSSGYGSQNLVYRFRVENYSINDDRVHFSAIDPTNSAIDDTIATQPDDQENWQNYNYSYISTPNSTFPEMILVGNSKVIMVFLRVTSFVSLMFAFGTYELVPEWRDTDELNIHYAPANASGYPWTNLTNPDYTGISYYYGIFSQNYTEAWWEGAATAGGLYRNLYPANQIQYNDIWNTRWIDGEVLCAANGFSGFRTMVSSPVFVQNSSDDSWNHVGNLPVYRIKWNGLSYGEIITRGSDNYLCIPNFYTTSEFGAAIKVNVP